VKFLGEEDLLLWQLIFLYFEKLYFERQSLNQNEIWRRRVHLGESASVLWQMPTSLPCTFDFKNGFYTTSWLLNLIFFITFHNVVEETFISICSLIMASKHQFWIRIQLSFLLLQILSFGDVSLDFNDSNIPLEKCDMDRWIFIWNWKKIEKVKV